MRATLLIVWGLRVLLELAAFAALCYWGIQTGGAAIVKLVLGLGAPGLAVLVWSKLVAPRAQYRLEDPGRFLAEAVVFVAAAAGLIAAGQAVLGIVFLVLAIGNAVALRRIDRT